jgi:hypothetical protein
MISILHPSRSRAARAYHTAIQWISHADCKIQHILSLDTDDPKLRDYPELDVVTVNRNRSAIDAINKAAEIASGDILIVVSDDFECFPGWGLKIEKLMSGKADWILKTQDGIQPWVITLPIMDRIYYERFGYIYHPDYAHAFCDTEMTCVADLIGRKFTSDMMFRHLNDGNTKIIDAVSEKNDATFESGRKIFIDRKKKLFNVPSEEISRELPDNIYTRM